MTALNAIVACAVTGLGMAPSLSPCLPAMVEEMITQSGNTAAATVAVPQVHARDAADGRLTSGIGVRQGFILAIRDHCDAEIRGFLDRIDFAPSG